MAIDQREATRGETLIHSDHGTRLTSWAFTERARQSGSCPSPVTSFEQLVASRGCQLLRPDRRDEPARHGSLGGVRQWIESITHTGNNQLSIERHGARTLPGLIARIAQRLLALAAVCWHNWLQGTPGRHFTAYGH